MLTSEIYDPFSYRPVEPQKEMAAYEALWSTAGATFKTIAETFLRNEGKTPSELVEPDVIEETLSQVLSELKKAKIDDFGVTVHGTADYPEKLRNAKYPLEFYYYQGNHDLAYSHKSVAVVGSRKPSEDGVRRARKLVKLLASHEFTIFSGLAEGIDTVAHTTAIDAGGRTVAVLGTPITETYPQSNASLQKIIANDFLVVSQVPILRYLKRNFNFNRIFFPERNATMSALADATVIVEAGETSGTLIQARAALYQGRKLFILDSCFNNPNITWPAKFEKLGAIRVKDFDTILNELHSTTISEN